MAVVDYMTFGDEIVYENRGGVERDYMRDPLGNTAALLDNTQTQTDTFTYWPYGEVNARTGTTATPFQFVGVLGYFLDPLNNLTYVRQRYSLPELARWLTVDPLWPSTAAYTYCASSPAVYADPSGLVAPAVAAGAAGCLLGGLVGGLSGWLSGMSAAESLCRAAVGCLVGLIVGAVSASVPVLAGCLIGIAAGVVSQVGNAICKSLSEGVPFHVNTECMIVSILFGLFSGCLAAVAGIPDLNKWLIKVAIPGLQASIASVCSDATQGRRGLFPPLVTPRGF